MQSISEKISDQVEQWSTSVIKAGKLLKLIEKMSNAYSVSEEDIPLGFDVYENYNHCFVVSFFPYHSMQEMSEQERSLSDKVHLITYDKEALDKVKVFMESLEDVQLCEYLKDGKLRVTFKK